MTNKGPHRICNMYMELKNMIGIAHDNFTQFISTKTLRGHTRDTTGLEKHHDGYARKDFKKFPQYQKTIAYLTISDEERLKIESIQKEDQIKNLKHKNTELLQLKQVDKLQYCADTRISRYKNVKLDINKPTMDDVSLND